MCGWDGERARAPCAPSLSPPPNTAPTAVLLSPAIRCPSGARAGQCGCHASPCGWVGECGRPTTPIPPLCHPHVHTETVSRVPAAGVAPATRRRWWPRVPKPPSEVASGVGCPAADGRRRRRLPSPPPVSRPQRRDGAGRVRGADRRRRRRRRGWRLFSGDRRRLGLLCAFSSA